MSEEQPQLEGAPEAAPPRVVDYEVGGKTFQIDPELAEALKAQPAVEAAPPPVAPPLPRVVAEPPQEVRRDPLDDLDTLWYTRPKDAYALIREQIVNEVRGEYTAEQRRRQIWDTFYQRNPDLANARPFVENVWQRHAGRLGQYDVDTGLGELAKQARQELLEATRGFGNTAPTAPALAEGATPPGTPRTAPASDVESFSSLSEAIRARREARRRAMTESRSQTAKG